MRPRRSSACLTIFTILTLTASSAHAQSCGDCDGNGAVTITDALKAASIASGLTPALPGDLPACDIDRSGTIAILDALAMAQFAVGLSPTMDCSGLVPPAAMGVSPLAPLQGDILVEYLLVDAEQDTCSVEVRISMDAGATFPLVATEGAGGEGLVGLSSSAAGDLHVFSWNSVVDLGFGVFPNLVVQVLPSDTQTGVPGQSGAFVIDNSGLNTPPTASAIVPSSMPPLSGDISFVYLLADTESDTASILVELSTDGGMSFPITATGGAGGDGTSGLATSPGGTPHVYVWDSLADLGSVVATNLMLRITPSDFQLGVADISPPFDVDNTSLPTVSYMNDIEPTILLAAVGSQGCVRCHGPPSPSQGLDLSGYTGLMAGAFSGPVVIPGDPGNSKIICKLEGPTWCGGSRMPLGGPAWTPTQTLEFRTWIQEGAMDN